MLRVIHHLHESLARSVDVDTDFDAVGRLDVLEAVARMKRWEPDIAEEQARRLMDRIDREVAGR
jgi:hypothetical protein